MTAPVEMTKGSAAVPGESGEICGFHFTSKVR